MSSKQEYQHLAVQCLRVAEGAKDDSERQILLEMADAWTLIALLHRDTAGQSAFDDKFDQRAA